MTKEKEERKHSRSAEKTERKEEKEKSLLIEKKAPCLYKEHRDRYVGFLLFTSLSW